MGSRGNIPAHGPARNANLLSAGSCAHTWTLKATHSTDARTWTTTGRTRRAGILGNSPCTCTRTSRAATAHTTHTTHTTQHEAGKLPRPRFKRASGPSEGRDRLSPGPAGQGARRKPRVTANHRLASPTHTRTPAGVPGNAPRIACKPRRDAPEGYGTGATHRTAQRRTAPLQVEKAVRYVAANPSLVHYSCSSRVLHGARFLPCISIQPCNTVLLVGQKWRLWSACKPKIRIRLQEYACLYGQFPGITFTGHREFARTTRVMKLWCLKDTVLSSSQTRVDVNEKE